MKHCVNQPGFFSTAVIIASCILAHGSFAHGQTEADLGSRIIKGGGGILKNKEGKIVSVHLRVLGEDWVESLDLTILKQLRSVTIRCGPFGGLTDRSLIHLQKIPPVLDLLTIEGDQVTSEGIGDLLGKQKSLQSLRLIGKGTTDATLSEIGKLEYLASLNLHATRITNKGLKSLVNLKKLTRLSISDTDIGDAGLLEIKQLQNLSFLHLRGTKVTDKGIRELAVIQNLLLLGISSTKVTEDGKKALHKLLPDLKYEK